jgi:hypothetical protein
LRQSAQTGKTLPQAQEAKSGLVQSQSIVAASEKDEEHVTSSDRNPAVKEDFTMHWNLEDGAPW